MRRRKSPDTVAADNAGDEKLAREAAGKHVSLWAKKQSWPDVFHIALSERKKIQKARKDISVFLEFAP